jgi:hypothetical protein
VTIGFVAVQVIPLFDREEAIAGLKRCVVATGSTSTSLLSDTTITFFVQIHTFLLSHCYSPFLKRQVKSFSTLNVSTIGNDSWIQRSGEIAASIDVSDEAGEFKLAA